MFRLPPVNLTCTDAEGKTTRREVKPMIFALTASRWKLVAWCRLRDGVRWFTFTGIQRATVTRHPFTRYQIEEIGEPPTWHTQSISENRFGERFHRFQQSTCDEREEPGSSGQQLNKALNPWCRRLKTVCETQCNVTPVHACISVMISVHGSRPVQVSGRSGVERLLV